MTEHGILQISTIFFIFNLKIHIFVYRKLTYFILKQENFISSQWLHICLHYQWLTYAGQKLYLHTTELVNEELLRKSTDTQKWRSNLCQELEFARICQWDFVSVVFIFQFVIQQAQFQHVDLSRKCFDCAR